MADAVVRYLALKHGIPAYRMYVVAMGNASGIRKDGAAVKRASGGRVEVSVLKNDLDQLASSSSASTSPR